METKYTSKGNFDYTEESALSALKNIANLDKLNNTRIVLGFDGYIDTLYRMVKNRKSSTEVEFFTSMKEFGQKIVDTAGSSGSIERVLKKKLGGGFTVNTGRAIANMNPKSQVDLIGTFGFPNKDSIFADTLPKNVNLRSIGEMGLTLAMEFNDGKIMSQDMEGINSLTWPILIERLGGRDKLIANFNNADIIGNGHWSLMPYMNNYWEKFLTDVFPNIDNLNKKFFFVDPADFGKRTKQEIRKMLTLLTKINDKIPVILSLNDREAVEVARTLQSEGVPAIEKGNAKTFEEGGKNINKIINLNYLVIHDPHFATISGRNYHNWVTEGYTSKPMFQTGAGDHFNGAIMLALKAGFSPAESLVIANAATAIFVRTGQSPSTIFLRKFLEQYMHYILVDDNNFEI